MEIETEKLVTPAEYARLIGKTRACVSIQIKQGKIKTQTVGGRKFVVVQNN